jgi:CRP-like cAMP-binding protein
MSHDPVAESTIAEQLAAVPMFASLDVTDRLAAVEVAEVLDVSPGETITREGTIADDFFVMLAGEATVSVTADDASDSIEVGIVRPGETLGELGALLDTPRTATVIAAQPCRLLRFDTAALEKLFATRPRFAMAISRELAHQLKQALARKNEFQIEQLPDSVQLAAPDVTRLREYMVMYYASALKNIVKQHRLLVDRRFPAYETIFTLTQGEHDRWLNLFDTRERWTPFTYHTTVGTMALMRVVGDVGVNFKNLMHLKCEMGMALEHPMESGQTFRLVSQIEDIIAVRDDRVALVCASRVFDEAGFRIRTYRDFFVILNLDRDYVEALRAARSYGHLEVAEFQGLASREPQLAGIDGVGSIAVDVPEGMGFSYGKVSGDLNLVHTTRLAAKLFGHPRPFIQGLCTANYVIRHLTPLYGPPESMSITFAKRVFVGQRIELLHMPGKFEVCDGKGGLLAFGHFESASGTNQ